MILRKIISGGQTGADQGALRAAKELGISTGGWMPNGWRTEAGPRPDLGVEFGLIEHSIANYGPRTETNVLVSDATLIFGKLYSPGSKETSNIANRMGKPLYAITWPKQSGLDNEVLLVAAWLTANEIVILNVAGNRESVNSGISDATRRFIVRVVSELRKT